jgi:CBS domain containing-hemolysin-like protein
LITLGRAKPAPLHREELLAVARLGEKAGALRQREGIILRNLMKLQDTRVKDIMTPQAVVFSLPQDTPLREFPGLVTDKPFSRIPVYKNDDPDEVTGFVLRSDVLLALQQQPHEKRTINSVRLPLAIVLKELEVDRLFERFIKERHQIMLVHDELGSVAGLVTLEDVVETIFGIEIVDEKDTIADLQAHARMLWQERAAQMGLEVDETGMIRTDGPR